MTNKKGCRLLSFALAILIIICAAATAFAKYETITYRSHPDKIRELQNALKKKRFYKGKVDGKFGPDTHNAVYRFQRSIGLKTDGRPGDRTLTALYEGTSAINNVNARKASSIVPKDPHSIHYGTFGARVRSLQKALKAAGYFKGTVDGVFGEMTELAVRKFQTARRLHVDGVAGTRTIASLNRVQKKVKISGSFLLSLGSRGEAVKSVQNALRGGGFLGNINSGYVLGVYCKTTADAVSKWQSAIGARATGAISESQYNRLILKK